VTRRVELHRASLTAPTRDLYYFPGGHREPGETDAETLVREIDEELQAAIDPESMVHFGTYETHGDHSEHPNFRMICYVADHHGALTPLAGDR
jgi:8-oxo-dGTP pyrophosphatase MutT (NUDIX family)